MRNRADRIGHRQVARRVLRVVRGTLAIPNASLTNTATISPRVVPDRTRIRLLGESSDRTGNTVDINCWGYLSLSADGTTLTYTRIGTVGVLTCNYELIEHAPGVVRIQRDTVQAVASLTANKTIVAVSDRAELELLGLATSMSIYGPNENKGRIERTSATNVRLTHEGTTGDLTAAFQVLDWLD